MCIRDRLSVCAHSPTHRQSQPAGRHRSKRAPRACASPRKRWNFASRLPSRKALCTSSASHHPRSPRSAPPPHPRPCFWQIKFRAGPRPTRTRRTAPRAASEVGEMRISCKGASRPAGATRKSIVRATAQPRAGAQRTLDAFSCPARRLSRAAPRRHGGTRERASLGGTPRKCTAGGWAAQPADVVA